MVLLPLYDHNYAFRFSESQPHYVEVGIIGSVNLNVLPTSHSCRPWQIASTTVVYVGDDESAVVCVVYYRLLNHTGPIEAIRMGVERLKYMHSGQCYGAIIL